MTPVPRKRIGRNAGAMTRELIYETADAIEVESREGYEVSRKRVLYEEVLLVTIHRTIGALYVVSTALVALFFGGVALTLQVTAPVAAITFGILAVPFAVACIARLVFKVDFVTVFGRRSKAVMRFHFRKRRARETYGRICSRTMEVQRAMVERSPEMPAPVDEPPETPAPVDEPTVPPSTE
jgi:hypothetical protein